jgi:ADP-ribosylglycohydrolase
MAEPEYADRVTAVVAGLVAGDRMSWPSWWHRLGTLPPRREVRLAEAWQHGRDGYTTSLPTPYLQSSPPSLVDPAGPTDDTEWFTVAVRHLAGQRLDGSPAGEPYAVWGELAERRAADPASVRGRVGTVIALDNLARGLHPPMSGNDNPHYFDDSASVRGIAAGLLRPGDPAAAAELAARDAEVTHALDGVWGARAIAALISALVSGADRAAAISAAAGELPAESWIAHVVAECLADARPGDAPLDLAARLERTVVDHVYSYANQAPETLGLLLAHLSVSADASALLLGALAHPRHADGLVPLAGAVAGAAFGDAASGTELPELAGACIAGLAGTSLAVLVSEIAEHWDDSNKEVRA